MHYAIKNIKICAFPRKKQHSSYSTHPHEVFYLKERQCKNLLETPKQNKPKIQKSNLKQTDEANCSY